MGNMNLLIHLIYIFFIVICQSCGHNFTDADPRSCKFNGGHAEVPHTFEVLPGLGWDNLVNENRGLVINYNYSNCRTTEDGRYLLPNDILVIPVKSSKINAFSKIYDHWTEYESDTALSINLKGHGLLEIGNIAGSFSAEYQDVKTHQIEDKSITTKVQAIYLRYSAKVMQPDVQLHPEFRNRILRIADHIQHDRKLSTQYESQLLIRDYGTHVITNIDGGASIVKVDHIESSILRDTSLSRFSISIASSLSLPELFGLQGSTRFSISNENVAKYNDMLTDSSIRAHGGPIVNLENFNLSDWSGRLENDLVAIDRDGFSLDSFITTMTFPALSEGLVSDIAQNIQRAISNYILHNTFKGCIDPTSPNFNKIANLDDGSCKVPLTNLSFGGVYQECTLFGQLPNNEDPCKSIRSGNPQTGDHSCPQDFEAISLYKGQTKTTRSVHSCHKHWIFFKRCEDKPVSATSVYKSFWCKAKTGSQIPPNSGFLFGGVYSNAISNFNTGSKSCPQYYTSLKVTSELYVCLSQDFELAMPTSVPFGGFYSCQNSNPLANDAGPCPKGFSNHLALMDGSCEIQFCIQKGQFSQIKLPKVQVPPFMDVPAESLESPTQYLISEDSKTWTKLVDLNTEKLTPAETKWTTMKSETTQINTLTKHFAKNFETMQSGKVEDENGGLSTGAVAGISIAATTVFCVFVGIFISIGCSRKHRSNQYNSLQ